MQEYGLQLLINEDQRLVREEKTERLKQVAVLTGVVPPHVIYPDVFPNLDEDEDAEGDFTAEEATPDYSAVTWEMPSESEDPEALLSRLDEFNNLTLLESEVGEDEGGEWL